MTNSSTRKQTGLSTGEHLSTGVRPYLGVGLGVTISSTAAILIRLAQAEAPSLVIAAWRLMLATLILAPVTLVLRRSELRALTRPGTGGRAWVSALASGLLLAIHFATWITSLRLTTVATSAVLVETNPFFVAVLSYLFLRERPSRTTVVGIVLAIAGSVGITVGDLRGGPLVAFGGQALLGDLLALVGGLMAAIYFLLGRRLRQRLSVVAYIWPVYTVAAVVLLAVCLLTGQRLAGYAPPTYLMILLLALGPQLLGHSSLNYALGQLSATLVTVAALGEPIGSALLALLLLGEAPPLLTLGGGVLILAGIALTTIGESARRGTGRRGERETRGQGDGETGGGEDGARASMQILHDLF